jgi:hypothetical protein
VTQDEKLVGYYEAIDKRFYDELEWEEHFAESVDDGYLIGWLVFAIAAMLVIGVCTS